MMAGRPRGADLVVRALAAAGTERIFTLSGNQIMSVFDACIDEGIGLLHVRHEAAAVHMADAWGRMTGTPAVALVTAGPGMANTLSALYVSMMAESPVVLLSGHAPLGELGRGAFQEMAQANMAAHVTKASWTAASASGLGRDVARAFRLATSGRPGPVHVSLPVDLLEAPVEGIEDEAQHADDFRQPATRLDANTADRVLAALSAADAPLTLAGPSMMRGAARGALAEMARVTRTPVVSTESPRGINDPSLGAFAEVLAQADLILLLGKKLDFTLKSGDSPAVRPDCRFIQVAPETQVLEQTQRLLAGPPRLAEAVVADPVEAATTLVERAGRKEWADRQWTGEVEAAISYRPAEWETLKSPPGGLLHAYEVCRAVQDFLASEDSVFVSDGGEFGQWAQALVRAPHRIINGTGGAIGGGIPNALAARLVYPNARIATVLGDGSFGFYAMEFDTAVRYMLPFVAVVGNDAAWNAEMQIQLREYGPERLVGCELLPSRYDQLAVALGGHGENVTDARDLGPALDRAYRSGLPACVNVCIERDAAPVVRRGR